MNSKNYYRYIVYENGDIYSTLSNRYLKQQTTLSGYKTVTLTINKKAKVFFVHRLVCELFKGLSTLEVNHINGIRSDNNISNLERLSHSDNIKHSYKELNRKKAKPYKAILCFKDGNIIAEYKGLKQASKAHNIPTPLVSVLCRDRREYKGLVFTY